MRALGLPAKHALFTFLSVDMLRLYAFVTMWAVQDAPFLRIENTRILLKLMRQTSVVLIPKVSSFCSLTLKTNMSLLELRRLWLIELRDGTLFADGNLVSFNLERFFEAFLEAVRSNVRICLGTWQICHFQCLMTATKTEVLLPATRRRCCYCRMSQLLSLVGAHLATSRHSTLPS